MKQIFQWIAVLPGAIISSILAFIVGSFIGYYSARMFIYGGDGRWIWALARITSNILAGGVLVYVGHLIAPKYKRKTAFVLAALTLVFMTVNITLQLVLHVVDGFWEQVEVYAGSVLTFVGAIIGYQVVVAEIKDDEVTPIKRRGDAISVNQWKPILNVGSSFVLTMEDGGKCVGTIIGIDANNMEYKVRFQEDVSLIPAKEPDEGYSDNAFPEKIHIITEATLKDILAKKLVGTTVHYHF